jgi:hypothetical protein
LGRTLNDINRDVRQVVKLEFGMFTESVFNLPRDKAAPLQGERESLRGRRIFFTCLILTTFGRLYLLRNEDIITVYSGYDDSLFVELGKYAFWWRPPDIASLVRLPVYPLWTWLCYQTSIPLYFGTNMLTIAASLFLVYALRKLHLPRFACTAVYAAQLFEINAIDSMRRVGANNLYGILFVTTLAWMALALASAHRRQLWIASGGLAVSLGLFAITRAESILASIAFICFVAAFILREVMASGGKGVSVHILSAAGLLPALALIVAPLVVAAANKTAFGVFASCSLTSPAFRAAMNHLLAVKPDEDIPYVPVTRDARKKAYAVSPAFEKLATFLEGSPGYRWGRHGVRYHVAPEEIAGGWFFFAFREAIAAATEARTPAQIEAYCWRIAEELQQAFKDGKIPKRHVWLSLVQPDPTIWLRMPTSLGRIFTSVLSPNPPVNILSIAHPLNSKPTIVGTFDRVTHRKSFGAIHNITISGWGFSNGQPVTSILVLQADGTSLPVTFKNFAEPKVIDANKDQYPSLRRDVPFGFTATAHIPHKHRPGRTMKFLFGDGTELPVQVAGFRPQQFALGGDAMPQTGWLTVESFTDAHEHPDFHRATQQMATVGKFYSLTFKILLVAVIPSLILLGIFRDSPAHDRRLYVWLLPLIGFVAARVAVLAIIDASSFNGTIAGYLTTIAGPLAAAVIALNAQALRVVYAFVSKPPKHNVEPQTDVI